MGIYSLHYFLSDSVLTIFIEVHVEKKNNENQFSQDRLYIIMHVHLFPPNESCWFLE